MQERYGRFRLWGEELKVEKVGSRTIVSMKTNEIMRIDDKGLIYGGVTFCLADYANMLTVRYHHPLSFLHRAHVRYIAPVKVGQEMVAEARLIGREERKYRVDVTIRTERKVFEGDFINIALEKHVLDE